MTAGHLRARAMAVPNGDRPQTARLVFDYQDVYNYKAAGLRTDAEQSQIPVRGQKWVLKVVQDGVESDPSAGLRAGLVPPVADVTLQPDHWYQLDLVVGLSKVTLYADGQEKIVISRAIIYQALAAWGTTRSRAIGDQAFASDGGPPVRGRWGTT